MLIMLPLLCLAMTGVQACMKLKADFRFVSITASHCASSILIISPSFVMPALFTSMSMRPKTVFTSSTTVWASAKDAASELYAFAFTPRASSSAVSVCAASCCDLYVKAMSAPSDANRKAIALPIPLVAPVTRAVFPERSPIVLLYFAGYKNIYLCPNAKIFSPQTAKTAVIVAKTGIVWSKSSIFASVKK